METQSPAPTWFEMFDSFLDRAVATELRTELARAAMYISPRQTGTASFVVSVLDDVAMPFTQERGQAWFHRPQRPKT